MRDVPEQYEWYTYLQRLQYLYLGVMGECGLDRKGKKKLYCVCAPPIQDLDIKQKGKTRALFFSLSDWERTLLSLFLLGEMLEAGSLVTLGRETSNGVDLVLAGILLRGLLPCLGLCDGVLATYCT